METIELISFKICPFVQRSAITLLKKGVDFKITYVDLQNKPDWFLAISPLGKVPVVKYGEDVLRSLTKLGLPASHVSLSSTSNPGAQVPEVHVYQR